MIKKWISIFFTLLMVMSCFSVLSFAEDSKILNNINDDAAYVLCSDRHIIDIDKALLHTDDDSVTEVYLISMMGSNFSLNPKKIQGLLNCFLSMFSIKNSYLDEVKRMALETIPEGSNIVLLGHSLGGMVAQQFSSDKEMKEKYNIIDTICVGSPFVFVTEREGDIHRISDGADIVPFMSPALFVNAFLGNFEFEHNGYFGRLNKAHLESYATSEKWAVYDCLGIKDGTSFITILCDAYDALEEE